MLVTALLDKAKDAEDRKLDFTIRLREDLGIIVTPSICTPLTVNVLNIKKPVVDRGNASVSGSIDLPEIGSEAPLRLTLKGGPTGEVLSLNLEIIPTPTSIPIAESKVLFQYLRSLPRYTDPRWIGFSINYDVLNSRNTFTYRLDTSMDLPSGKARFSATVQYASYTDNARDQITAAGTLTTLPTQDLSTIGSWAGVSIPNTLNTVFNRLRVEGFSFAFNSPASRAAAFSEVSYSFTGKMDNFLGSAASLTLSASKRLAGGSFDFAGSVEMEGWIFDISVYGDEQGDILLLSGGIPKVSGNTAGLDDLPFHFSDSKMSSHLPAELPSTLHNSISVTQVFATFDLKAMSLTAVGAEASIAGKWEIVPDVFTLSEISMRLELSRAPGKDFTARAIFVANCSGLDPLTMQAQAVFPDGYLSLAILNPTQLTTTQEVKEIGPLRIAAPGIALRTLNGCTYFKSKNYLLHGELDSQLSFNGPNGNEVKLEQVEFSLGKTGADPIELSFLGKVSIGDSRFTAGLQKSSNQWSMSGQLENVKGEQTLPWLFQQIGMSVPDALASLAVDSVSLNYSLGSRSVKFDCAGSLDFWGSRGGFHVSIHNAPGKWDMQGHLFISISTGSLVFDVEKQESGNLVATCCEIPKGVIPSSILPGFSEKVGADMAIMFDSLSPSSATLRWGSSGNRSLTLKGSNKWSLGLVEIAV
ncbi:hypothetical protein [Streptomyces wuyuanensis]|uniref:hypothetical protein n=1 Tax=Streptomyces wuyuanensis TaxID=1196353 RepID=UPI00343AA830